MYIFTQLALIKKKCIESDSTMFLFRDSRAISGLSVVASSHYMRILYMTVSMWERHPYKVHSLCHHNNIQSHYINWFDYSYSMFTWDPKWAQTDLKSQTVLKCSDYMAIYLEISLWQLSKQQQDSIAHVQVISFN